MIKLFSASFDVIILRYFLAMFIAIGAFMTGMNWLAILCFPIVLMALTGVKIDLKAGS